MEKEKHKLGIKLPTNFNCCSGINIYIDREKVNAIGLYPLDKNNRRIDLDEEMDVEFDFAELEVRDIEDIALLMNRENFDRFCKLWRERHEE